MCVAALWLATTGLASSAPAPPFTYNLDQSVPCPRGSADYSIAASLYHFQLFLVYGAARIALISAGESNMQNSERGRYLTARDIANLLIESLNFAPGPNCNCGKKLF